MSDLFVNGGRLTKPSLAKITITDQMHGCSLVSFYGEDRPWWWDRQCNAMNAFFNSYRVDGEIDCKSCATGCLS